MAKLTNVTKCNMNNTIDITDNKFAFQIIKILDDNNIKYNVIYKTKKENMGMEYMKIQFETPEEAVKFKMEYM